MHSHSACTKHLRRFQLIQLRTFCTLTVAVDLDPMIAAKSPYTRFVPRVVPARTLTRSVQDARDSIVRDLSGEFSDDVGCWYIEDPAMFSAARFAHVKLGVISSLPMNLQIDLIAVNASDDLEDDSTQDALARLRCCRPMAPCALEVCTECQK